MPLVALKNKLPEQGSSISQIGQKLESYPSGTHEFWANLKAELGNFRQPSLSPLSTTGNDILVHKEEADFGRSLCLELDFG